MLLKLQLHWAGHIFRMGNHSLLRNIWYSTFSTKEEHQISNSKTAWKKSLAAGNIIYHQQSTLAENPVIWGLTTNHVVSSFENTHRATIKDKRHRRKNHSTIPANFNQPLWPCLPAPLYQLQMSLQSVRIIHFFIFVHKPKLWLYEISL